MSRSIWIIKRPANGEPTLSYLGKNFSPPSDIFLGNNDGWQLTSTFAKRFDTKEAADKYLASRAKVYPDAIVSEIPTGPTPAIALGP